MSEQNLEPILQPLTLRGLTLPHRVAMSPMCQYSAENGFPTAWHFRHYAERAVGGASLVILEATAVRPEGRISPDDLGIWDDEHAQALAKLVDQLHDLGVAVGVQLAHAGRKASVAAPWKSGKALAPHQGGWTVRAPSAVPFAEGDPVPSALSSDEIAQVLEAFAAGARRAHQAGFDVIELHSAHGYLLHQFLSPLANQRADAWGGSFDGRVRLAVETARALRSVWPAEKPLLARISATDWAQGGWTPDETVKLARLWKAEGVDLVDVSSGGVVPGVKIPLGPGYQVPYAAQVRAEASIPTAAVGLLQDWQQISEVVASGQADLILLGRQLLRDPYWLLRHLPASFNKVPPQYQRAF